MTITTDITPVIAYSGNGSTTAFAVPFVFYTSDDLVVVLTDSGGTDTTQTNPGQYSVSGGGSVEPGTGTVTMVSAPASGETLTIYRTVEKSQDVDYILYNTFPAELHEKALDKLTLIAQDLSEEIGRAAKVSRTSGLSGLVFPDPSASKIIAWNSLGTALENVDMATAILNINALTAETSIDGTADYLPIYDASAAANRKVLPQNLPVGISNLTEDTTPDAANDFVITYDASAGVNKKVKIQNIPQTGGNAPVSASYLTLATNATLTSERVLTASTAIALTDNGAGNTLDVAVNVNSPSEKVTPVLADFVLGYDVAGTATKKFKVQNIPIPPVNNETTDTSLDSAADYVLIYDTSAGTNKKIIVDNFTGGVSMTKLATTTISGSVSSVDFTNLSSTYKVYVVDIIGLQSSLAAPTTTSGFTMRTSTDNGATFTSGAANYTYAQAGASSSNSTFIALGLQPSTGNNRSSGRVVIFGAMDSGLYTTVTAYGSSVYSGLTGAWGGYRAAAEANNAIRFMPTSGSYTAGTFVLYGLK